MKFIKLYLIFYVLISSASAYETKAVLRLENEKIKMGNIYDGEIFIWPIEGILQNDIMALEGQVVFDWLFINKVYSQGFSKNNKDVYEVYIQAIPIVSKLPAAPFIWSIRDLNIPVEFKVGHIEPTKVSIKDFIIKKPNFKYTGDDKSIWHYLVPNSKQTWPINLLITFFDLVLLFVGAHFWVKIKKRKIALLNHKKKIIEKARWRERISQADSRESYEELYRLKNDWTVLVDGESQFVKDFNKILNKHQFKKKWGIDDLKEVEEVTKTLKRLF